jgi:hypothetical protein
MRIGCFPPIAGRIEHARHACALTNLLDQSVPDFRVKCTDQPGTATNDFVPWALGRMASLAKTLRGTAFDLIRPVETTAFH